MISGIAISEHYLSEIQVMKYATIKEFEVMCMIKKQQFRLWTGLPETLKEKLEREIRLIERQFYYCYSNLAF